MDTSGFAKARKRDWNSLEELFEQHAGLSFEKQLLFADVIGSNPWQFTMNTGSISFGPQLNFPVQVIGSLSFNDYSWMWGWANTKSGIPEELLIQSNKMKSLGTEKGIEILTKPHFSVDEGFEHIIGMTACGLFKAKSYYCANYGQGTLVVTIDSDKIPSVDVEKIEKVLTCFPQLISSLKLDHKNTLINYLIDREFDIKEEENKIEGLRNNKIVKAEFDESSRLTSLKAEI